MQVEEETEEENYNKSTAHHPGKSSINLDNACCTTTDLSWVALSKQGQQKLQEKHQQQQQRQHKPNDQAKEAAEANIPYNSNQFAPVATENARDLTKKV